jgi:hypothetical protein
MPDKLLRCLVGVAGVAVVAAATYANVMHAGGVDAKETPLIIALAALLIIGMAFAMVSWIEKRKAQALVLGLCLLCGEAYWALVNLDREVTDRDVRAYPIIEARKTRNEAVRRVTEAEAKVAAVPTTSSRLNTALGAKAAVDATVLTKSADLNCRVNCKELLQGQVRDAQREVDAARSELEAEKQSAEQAMKAAKAALEKLPDPPSATALPDRLGIAPWLWDLILAGLRTAGIVGGSLALGFAIHPRRQKTETSKLAAQEVAAARNERAQRLEVRPVPAITHQMDARERREHVSLFLHETIRPDVNGSLSLEALAARYSTWCKSGALPSETLGEELRAIFHALDLRLEPQGRDVVVHGASIAQAIAGPKSSAA